MSTRFEHDNLAGERGMRASLSRRSKSWGFLKYDPFSGDPYGGVKLGNSGGEED